MGKGLFIVIEGIDGAGKTTQADMLAAALSAKGRKVLVTRDPGGTALGEELRNVLLYSAAAIDPRAEAMLYAAARAQLVAEKILPALDDGAVVVSDRFADSTHAYQGSGRGICPDLLDRLNGYACRGLVPDLTVLLDLDPARAAARLNRPADRMEREGREFLQRVRHGYLERAKQDPGRYLVLDASLPPGELFARVMKGIDNLLAASDKQHRRKNC
ncbi:MAG: dTMP kinase [Peptococcaceae bacterium]|nr:dTMP kinase [Peptococcaceae bacterium]